MKKLLSFVFILFLFVSINNANGFDVSLSSSSLEVAKEQEFYIDINLDPQNESLNGISYNLSFDNQKINFVRDDISDVVISHFLEKDISATGDTINISGITPNGFKGYANSEKQAKVMRLVFKPILSGETMIKLNDIMVTKNDGVGTAENLPDKTITIKITNDVLPYQYKTEDNIKPTLDVSITKSSYIDEKHKMLVYFAEDKESGLKYVIIKENNSWKEISSPYVLESFKNKLFIKIRAVDFNENFTQKNIFLPGYNLQNKNILYIILFLFVFFSIKLYVKYKNKI